MKIPDELIFLKNRNEKQKKSSASMKGKLCIITGATSGVGLETLKQFAKAGAHNVIICRNSKKAEAVKKEIQSTYDVTVDIILADFSSLSEVRKAAALVLEKYKHIDVLVNNAGMHSTKLKHTPEGFELVYCVNHLSSFLFTMLLLERMKESAPSRILQVNSEGHRFNGLDPDDINWNKRHYTGLKGYGASKTAQLLTVWELASRLKGTGVTINAVHPGDVKTGIGNNNGMLYRYFNKIFIKPFLKDSSLSGEAIYYLAAEPSMADINGLFFHLTIEEKPAKHALDKEMGNRIWKQSILMIGLED